VEILLWLAPAALVTVIAMVGIAWWGREGRGEVDRDTAARRLGEALAREQRSRPGYAVPPKAPEHSSGVALRPSRSRPVAVPGETEEAAAAPARTDRPAAPDRRAS